jgi:ribosomal-protein-alanine N-acetyltransferase
MRFEILALAEADAVQMTGWHYDPPYAAYDPPPDMVGSFVDPENRYFAVKDDAGHLVGFCCFGEHARIPGVGYDAREPQVLDVGVGLRPDMTGRGFGRAFVAAILEFAGQRFGPTGFRVTIAERNRRSIRVFEAAGFEFGDRFGAFVTLLKWRFGGPTGQSTSEKPPTGRRFP